MTYLGTFDLAATMLTTYPGNPRRGDVEVIRQSIREHGQYRAIVARAHNPKDPGAGGVVLAGNHTLMAIVAEHAETHCEDPTELDSIRAGNEPGGSAIVRVEMHALDDDTAAKIVAVDNRAADRGEYDDQLLAELLGSLDNLSGTGYDNDDLDALVKSLSAPDLDDLADEVGEPGATDGWPTINLRVPHPVKAAWNSHLSTFDDQEAAAFASLLGVEVDG